MIMMTNYGDDGDEDNRYDDDGDDDYDEKRR